MVGLGDTIHQVEADEECAILLGDVAGLENTLSRVFESLAEWSF